MDKIEKLKEQLLQTRLDTIKEEGLFNNAVWAWSVDRSAFPSIHTKYISKRLQELIGGYYECLRIGPVSISQSYGIDQTIIIFDTPKDAHKFISEFGLKVDSSKLKKRQKFLLKGVGQIKKITGE